MKQRPSPQARSRAKGSEPKGRKKRPVPARLFQRTAEDFSCAVCNTKVSGDGYTNHCPACLWSKHVDVNPGDRLAACQGLMRPLSIEVKGGEKWLTHLCESCSERRRIRLRDSDSMEAILRVMQGGLPHKP